MSFEQQHILRFLIFALSSRSYYAMDSHLPQWNLHKADSTIAALTGSMASHGFKDKRPNFPLPRELRDRIYEFLLDGACVEECRYRNRNEQPTTNGFTADEREARSVSVAPTYKFHTNILAVNKQIAKEAGKILFEANNRFVVVEHYWPFLMSNVHTYDVPILLDDRAAVLPEKIFLTFSVYHHLHSEADAPDTRNFPKRRFLMLWRDFPKFKSMLQWMFFQFPAQMNTSPQSPDAMSTGDASVARPIRTVITFTSLKNMDDRQASDFATSVATFSDLIIPGQEMFVDSLEPEPSMLELARSTLRTTGRRDVDLHVAIWHAIDTARDLKSHADDLTLSGLYETSRWRYGSIFGAFENRLNQGLCRWTFLEHLPAIKQDGKAVNALATLLLLTLDVAVTVARIHLSDRNFNALYFSALKIVPVQVLLGALVDSQHVAPDLKDLFKSHPCVYMLGLSMIFKRGSSDFDEDEDYGISLEQMIGHLQAMCEAHPDDAWIKHDLDLFSRISASEMLTFDYMCGGLITQQVLATNLSGCTNPVPILDTPVPDCVAVQRPTKRFGWNLIPME